VSPLAPPNPPLVPNLGLHTILAITILILYVEWQHRGLGGKPCIAQYRLQHILGAIKEVSSATNSIDKCTIPESTNEYLVKVNPEMTVWLNLFYMHTSFCF